jgi:hypothetical protein
MKKTILLLLCVLLLLSLYGCDEPIKNIDPSTNDTEIFQPAPTIVPPSDVYAGMLLDEFWELYPQREDTLECQGLSWGFDGYMFIYDDHNNPVVITYHSVGPGRPREDYYLTSVVAYDRNSIVISEARFRSIKEGMTLHDVVALVGNPYGNPDAAGLTLGWHCGEGIRFCIKWAKHPDDPNVLIVKNVYRADDIAGTYESIFD